MSTLFFLYVAFELGAIYTDEWQQWCTDFNKENDDVVVLPVDSGSDGGVLAALVNNKTKVNNTQKLRSKETQGPQAALVTVNSTG